MFIKIITLDTEVRHYLDYIFGHPVASNNGRLLGIITDVHLCNTFAPQYTCT